jgi:hypothetical protein
VTAKWADLENSLAARVQTETAFASVASTASGGFIDGMPFPAALITIVEGQTVDESAIAGAYLIRKRVGFQVLIATRIGGQDTRLLTGGIWDLYDKLQAKLLGFTPRGSVRRARPPGRDRRGGSGARARARAEADRGRGPCRDGRRRRRGGSGSRREETEELTPG